MTFIFGHGGTKIIILATTNEAMSYSLRDGLFIFFAYSPFEFSEDGNIFIIKNNCRRSLCRIFKIYVSKSYYSTHHHFTCNSNQKAPITHSLCS